MNLMEFKKILNFVMFIESNSIWGLFPNEFYL